MVGAHHCDRNRALGSPADDRCGNDVRSHRSLASALGVPARLAILSAVPGGARRAMADLVVAAVGVCMPRP